MKKIAVLALLFLVACTTRSYVTFPNGAVVEIELAITAEEKTTGLMDRAFLAHNAGMLFISEEPRTQTFWMKNTLIPLDLIFLKKDGTVIDIKEHFEPCETVSCPTYTSKAPAQYVLEVNAGFAAQQELAVGDTLQVVLQ